MCLGIAKVDQETIAEILGHMPGKALDDVDAGGLVRLDHLAQLLGVELPCQAGGVDHVAEQHSELAAFRLRHGGGSQGRWCLMQGRLWRGRRSERRPRLPQPDENAALLVPRHVLSVDEFNLKVLNGLVIELELPLERTIRYTPPL